MSKSSYLCIFVFSKTCGHCTNFKNKYYNSVIQQISTLNNPKVDVLTIEVDKNSDSIPSKYPKALSSVVKWFPNFILVPRDKFDNNTLTENDIHILNGRYDVDNKKVTHEPKYLTSDKGILDWIKEKVNSSNQQIQIDQIKNLIPPTETLLKSNYCSTKKRFRDRNC